MPGLFSNIRQKRVDEGRGALFPGLGTIPDPTPGSRGARPQELADELVAREDARQGDILQGRNAIESAFAGFDSNFFNQHAQDVTGHFFPQIDEQFGRANARTRASLADRGVGQSSIAGNRFGELLKTRLDARTNAANSAVGSANELRGNVERAKTDLFNLNASAADPAAANTQALAAAGSLVAPPTTSPLGDVFGAALGPIQAGIQSYQNRGPAPYTPIAAPGGGVPIPRRRPSTTVVN